MRRTEFIAGIQQLHDALVESRLQAMLESLLRKEKSPETAQMLTVLKDYAFEARHFNEAAEQLTHLLGLDELESPATWTKFIGGVDEDFLHRQYEHVSVVTDYLPQVAALLHHSTKQTLEDAGLPDEEGGRLKVLVIEQDHRLSTPQRLAELFTGLATLYEVCDAVTDVQGDKLSVVSCESGRDKAFELVGAPEVISEMKNLIMGMWDRVVFFREQELADRIERVASSLFLHERIEEREQNQQIGPEQAEILRRKLREGVRQFMEAGALIPEIEERAQYDPRRLMTPEPKLLVGSSAEEASSSAPAEARPSFEVREEQFSSSSEPAASADEPAASAPPTSEPETEEPASTPTPSPSKEEPASPEASAPAEEPPASEPAKPDPSPGQEKDRDGVMEVLEAIAERHEAEQQSEASSSASPEAPSEEKPDTSSSSPKPSPPQREDASASHGEEASTPTDPSSSEPEEASSSTEPGNISQMFDRLEEGGKHLFGNPRQEDDDDRSSS